MNLSVLKVPQNSVFIMCCGILILRKAFNVYRKPNKNTHPHTNQTLTHPQKEKEKITHFRCPSVLEPSQEPFKLFDTHTKMTHSGLKGDLMSTGCEKTHRTPLSLLPHPHPCGLDEVTAEDPFHPKGGRWVGELMRTVGQEAGG